MFDCGTLTVAKRAINISSAEKRSHSTYPVRMQRASRPTTLPFGRGDALRYVSSVVVVRVQCRLDGDKKKGEFAVLPSV